MSSTKKLPLGWRIRYALCNYHKRPNCWLLLLPEEAAIQCLGLQQAIEEKYGLRLGLLSLAALLPESLIPTVLFMIVVKNQHTWREIGRLVFWDAWTDPQFAGAKKTRRLCGGIVTISIVLVGACFMIGRYIVAIAAAKGLI